MIRRAEPQDRAAVEAIVHAAYSVYVERIGKPPGPMLDESLRRPERRARRVPPLRRDPPVAPGSSAAHSSTLPTVPRTRLDSVSGPSLDRLPLPPVITWTRTA